MKKTFVKQMIATIMSVVLVVLFVISSGATVLHETYHGTIELDSNSPDTSLSGIEIKVYSAQPVYDTESLKLLYYGETYAFSVWTDENGNFSFVKPTAFCSITIDTESLPDGYGINRMVQFIADGVTSHTFLLAEVSEIDVTMESDQVAAHFYAEDGMTLYVDYQIEEFPITMESLSSKQIKEMSSYDVSGKVITSDGETPYSFPVDLSEYSLQTKADYFYQEGMISEAKKIDVYCDILLDESLGVQLESGTIVVNEILAYKKNVLEKREKDVGLKTASESASVEALSAEKVDRVSEMTNRSTSNYSAYVQRTLGGNFVLRVRYDPNELVEQYAVKLVDAFEESYNFFVTQLGFNAPIPHTASYYEVTYVMSIPESGLTIYESNGKSRIEIDAMECHPGNLNKLKFVVAHEFHHAIMATYGFNTNSGPVWAREGFSNLAALFRTGSALPDTNTWNQIAAYIGNSHLGLESASINAYGAMILPLYIYEVLGGWNTIKEIYTNFSTTGNIYTAITNSSWISKYEYVFIGMFSRNYKPSAFYTTFASLDSSAKTILDSAAQIYNLDYGTTPIFSLPAMAGKYLQFARTTNVGTVNFTCEVTSGSGNGINLDIITETSSGLPDIITEDDDFTRVTFVEYNFGSTIKKLTLALTNSKATNQAISYRISIS
ncbi:MAG: hypothetical protein IKA76_08730 [Clostridia bacterium]|nr:hypothetical protein [Clostridia bacterium]